MESSYGRGYWAGEEVDGVRSRCDALRGEYEEMVRSGGGVVEEKAWLLRALTAVFWEPGVDLKSLSHRGYSAQPLKALLGLQGPVWATLHSLHLAPFFLHLPHCPFPNLSPRLAQRVEGLSSVEIFAIFFGSHLFQRSYAATTVDASDSLYFFLLQEYCSYFLPSSGFYSPLQSLLPTTPGPGEGAGSLQRWDILRTPLGLFKRCLYEESRSGAGEVRRGGGRGGRGVERPAWAPSVAGKTEAFVGTLASLWLHQDSEEDGVLEGRVLAARFLIKQIHHFAYTPAAPEHGLEELKEAVLPGLLARALLPFLLHYAHHWPLDASFRPFLETWLSYIQPWRYTGQGFFDASDDRWRHFVRTNIEFYTTLYSLAIERLSRMELCSAKNSVLAVRLSKVFAARDGLTEMVEDVDSFRHPQPPILPFLQHCSEACNQMGKLKWEMEESGREAGGSWLGWLSLSFGDADARAERLASLGRLLGDLKSVRESFARAYALQLPDIPDYSPGEPGEYCADGEPDSYLDVSLGRRRLTPLGRSQVLAHTRRFRFDSSAATEASLDISDPHDYEIRPLVKFCYKVGEAVNRVVGRRCGELYEAGSVEGWVTRGVARGPSRVEGYGSPDIRRRPLLLPARLSFRALASLRTLTTLLLALLLYSLPIPTTLRLFSLILLILSWFWSRV